ncbi:non-homologous end-joining DNA ligase [Paraburkholderia bannensis]|uniref:non-homologous end-joining DNA ligase n=1 Tax=Paraburkholderia bannensis TaxID=765414 RepID=UPI002AC31C9E|nr:non-homologous end-joining DNA ligase [Paraburkholderia bannensis]
MQDAPSTQTSPTRTPTGARKQLPDNAPQATPEALQALTLDAAVSAAVSPVRRSPRALKQAAEVPSVQPAQSVHPPQPASGARARNARASTTGEVAGVHITSARRIVDVDSGVRKLDLVRYYARAAPWLLPHLRDRPVSLLRAPQGLNGERVFQRHLGRMPIPGVTLHDELDGGHPLIGIDSLEALINVAQLDAIELHTWSARAADVESPDRVVFDLDPDLLLGWDRVIEAAELMRALLGDLGLESFCQTSGGKGLHIVVPLVQGASWDDVKAFARAVAQRLASGWPTLFTATQTSEHHRKKVYVDYLRNVRGAGTAVAYSVRARSGMGVSVPIAWEELAQTTGGAHWTLANIDVRLKQLNRPKRPAPWARYSAVRQSVSSDLTLRLEEGGA